MPTATKSRAKTNKTDHQEIAHIREDLDSLRHNVVALSSSLQHDVKETALGRLEKVRTRSNQALEAAEENVREHPARSVLTAFGVGLVLSALMRRD